MAREQQPISWSCRDCDFRVGEEVVPNGFKECWGDLASPTPHIFDLWKFGSTRLDGHPAGDRMIERRTTSLYDVTPDLLVKKDGSATKDSGRQLVQIEHSRSGTEWVGRDLGPALDALESPLHFIDFETSQLAVPYHAGMRPYEREWRSSGAVTPSRAPEMSRATPNRSTTRPTAGPTSRLPGRWRDVLGDRGTVLAWSHYEGNILAEIHEQLTRYQRGDAALIAWIAAARERIVDLHKLFVAGYFHPAMGGRTSIKIVLDALWSSDPEMRRQFERWGGGAGGRRSIALCGAAARADRRSQLDRGGRHRCDGGLHRHALRTPTRRSRQLCRIEGICSPAIAVSTPSPWSSSGTTGAGTPRRPAPSPHCINRRVK